MIDQEIRDALKVEPSPEFVARVRTRIAAEPAPSRWRWSWTFAAAGALAAALLIAVVISRPAQQTSPATDVVQAFPPPRAVDGAALRRGSPKLPGSEGGRPAIAGLKPRATSHESVVSGFSRTAPSRGPEVLVNAAEMRALQALIAGVREGRVDLAAAQTNAAAAPSEQEPVTDIVIAPITIDPIAPLSGAEGVRP